MTIQNAMVQRAVATTGSNGDGRSLVNHVAARNERSTAAANRHSERREAAIDLIADNLEAFQLLLRQKSTPGILAVYAEDLLAQATADLESDK